MPFRGILFLLRRFRLFEFGHHALHFPADFGGAEIADAAFVGVAHLARRAVLAALYSHADLFVGFAEGNAFEHERRTNRWR